MPHPNRWSSSGPNWRRYLRFWRANVAGDIDDELRFHFESRSEELRALGVPPDEIERIILAEFGDVATTRRRLRQIGERVERQREHAWWWHQIVADFSYTIRGLRRHPSFAIAVILTLALGLGANAAIFSVVDRMLFRAPPMMHASSRVHRVYIHSANPGQGPHYLEQLPYAEYLDLTRSTTSFDRTALYRNLDLAIGIGDDAREVPVGEVSASFFGFFNAPPVLGRYFTVGEDAPPSGTPVVVLSYGTWQTRYAGSPDVLGKTLQVGPTLCTVIGVAPRGFVGTWPDRPPAAFIPFATFAAGMRVPSFVHGGWTGYGAGLASMLVERKPNVTNAMANADLTHAAALSLRAEDGNRAGKPSPEQYAVAGSVLAERGPNQTIAARVAELVGAMALLVLLVAAANVANLLVARALRRRREVAVRLTLGASRGRLLSQLLVESLTLAVLGGVIGLVVAQSAGSPLRRVFLPVGESAPVIADERTLIFVAVAVIAIGVLAGLAPAALAQRSAFTSYLKLGAYSGTIRKSRLRAALLVIQAALSVLLLVGAGLFVRSLENVRRVPLGFDVAPVLRVSLKMRGHALDSTQAVGLRNRLLATAQHVPGVERAALSAMLPFDDRWQASIFRAPAADRDVVRHGDFNINWVSPDYFSAMGMRIVRGRGFDRNDAAGAPGAVVVSSAMANLLWPGKDAIGQCVQLDLDRECRYVVGIAADIKNTRLSDDPGLVYYAAAAQYLPQFTGLVLRMQDDAGGQVDVVRRALQREMPGASYVTVTPFAELFGVETHSWQLGATMFVAYGVLALVLAAVGLYSVIAYDVEQRTHEVGVRSALGATPWDIVWLVLRQGLRLAAVGIAMGGAAALIVSRQLAPLLFEISPRDPLVYGLVAAAMLTVAAVASFVPARHAASVDPTVALRSE